MDKLAEMLKSLELDQQLNIEEIPTIDLYMDQVTQLFERAYGEGKRKPDDKILTKTMINNYAKGKLLFPIKNKKYSKEHVMLINMIYQLKGTLSINDVKDVLDPLNTQTEAEPEKLSSVYEDYLSVVHKSHERLMNEVDILVQDVQDKKKDNSDLNSDYLEQFLLIASFAHMSNSYRKMAEKLVDELEEKHEKK
ncbi:DUF1836 domain-containing protein [Saliterribacillus persicus]|uniref:Uncharacterized protein DUF1836 n=1 Tax=Saliterribacillus persicus TaxID=930114 RepID=A0A368Y955_9BACI|nr:DUF1836 domain-containing protein [Saliterribacillus persicus]RCW76800.1 uncharacterized protein DUF1836 [Saliterribacillus persicus]